MFILFYKMSCKEIVMSYTDIFLYHSKVASIWRSLLKGDIEWTIMDYINSTSHRRTNQIVSVVKKARKIRLLVF